MDIYRRPGLFVFSILLFYSCSKPAEKKVTNAYYYWRMDMPTRMEKEILAKHEIEKLYVHLLDVDWNSTQGAIPVAQNRDALSETMASSRDSFRLQLVPVTFITNKTFEKIDSFDIPQLAKRIVRRCLPGFDEEDRRYESNYYISNDLIIPKEVQIDCDWTAGTKEKYFRFLKEVRRLLPGSIILSATVRLHQFKYPSRTGVPPVNRGMLMLYNISDPRRYNGGNSIFEEKGAAAYFTPGKSYPLPMDVVLPAWSWCIIYRDGQFYQVENGLSENELADLSFLKQWSDHRYTVTADTVYRNLFLRIGDEIKVESTDRKTLMAAASLGHKAINSDSFSVSLFELSETEYQRYDHETIREVFTSFR